MAMPPPQHIEMAATAVAAAVAAATGVCFLSIPIFYLLTFLFLFTFRTTTMTRLSTVRATILRTGPQPQIRGPWASMRWRARPGWARAMAWTYPYNIMSVTR